MVRKVSIDGSVADVISALKGLAVDKAGASSGTAVFHSEDGTKTAIGQQTGTAGIVPFVGDTTPPPVPSAPACDGSAGVLVVGWDGGWVNSVEATPPDFAGIIVEVQGGEYADFTEVDRTLVAAGSVPIAVAPGDYQVRLRSFDNAHDESLQPAPNVSEPSSPVAVTVVSAVDQAVVDQLQSDLSNNEQAITVLNSDLSQAQADIATAQSSADAAQTAAATAQATATSKNAVFRQASQPSTSGRKVGDVWFDTDDGNRIYTWSGSAWSPTLLGTAGIAAKAVTSGLLADGAVGSTQLAAGVTASITAAQSAADAAQTDADSAASAAADAAAHASAARATADAAADAAAAAAGVAAGKGDVLIQSAEPAAAMQKATTLWIDTTSGANTPKRWNGSSWVQVTDKAAVDAATAAANAQWMASSAYTAAVNAQSTADTANAVAAAAQTAAEAAQSAATAAQTTADGKSRVVRSSSAPSSVSGYSAGDQWWQYSSGTITGLWFHDGSAWVQQTLTNTVISNLDAGKITTGSLGADRIAAGSITASKLVSGTITAASGVIADAAIGTAQIINGAVTNAKIQDAAITNAKIANLDAGKITTGTLAADRIAAGSVTAEKIAASAVVADKLAANSVVAGKLAANSVSADKIVSNAVTADKIAANAVTAVKLASNAVTADKISAGAITAGKLSATAIDGKTITGATIIAENTSGVETVRIDGATGKLTAQDADIIGTLATGSTGNRVEVTTGSSTGNGGTTVNAGYVNFYGGLSGEQPGQIISTSVSDNGYQGNQVSISGGARSPSAFNQLYTKPTLMLGSSGLADDIGYSYATLTGDTVMIASYDSHGNGGGGIVLDSSDAITLCFGGAVMRKWDASGEYVWTSDGWVPAQKVIALPSAKISSNGFYEWAVEFGVTYPTTPHVVVAEQNNVNVVGACTANNRTTTGCRVTFRDVAGFGGGSAAPVIIVIPA